MKDFKLKIEVIVSVPDSFNFEETLEGLKVALPGTYELHNELGDQAEFNVKEVALVD